MAKPPFERVFSLIERKKLLQRVAQEKTKILLKSPKNEVFEFRPSGIENGSHLTGTVTGALVRDFDKVTALFYVGQERYFMTTRIKKNGEQFLLLNDAQFYRFNRRQAFRIQVPTSLEVSFYISTVRNIEINKKVPVIEFSSGGARIFWEGDRRLSKGTLIRGSLQWSKGKVLPVDAHVIHSPDKGIFALRFVNLNTVLSNRLKMLSVEIQQALYFH